RTGGLANGTYPPRWAGTSGTGWAGCAGSGATPCGWAGAPPEVAPFDPAEPADALRGLRFVLVAFEPYPTSGFISSDSAADDAAASPPAPFGTAPGAAGAPASAGGAPPVPAGSTSTVRIGVPTSTVWPGSTSNSVTTPAHGMGSSTAAFAVSTSTTIWLTFTSSPGCTFQPRISASVSPSAVSARGNCLYSGMNPPHHSSARSTAYSTRSRSGRKCSSSLAGGYGVSNPVTRCTGASRE